MKNKQPDYEGAIIMLYKICRRMQWNGWTDVYVLELSAISR